MALNKCLNLTISRWLSSAKSFRDQFIKQLQTELCIMKQSDLSFKLFAWFIQSQNLSNTTSYSSLTVISPNFFSKYTSSTTSNKFASKSLSITMAEILSLKIKFFWKRAIEFNNCFQLEALMLLVIFKISLLCPSLYFGT